LKLFRLAGLFLFFALIGSPQTADPLIRVDVNLRQVDLIVTDAKGNHVSDLQPTDFQLIEDGKPQKIANFSWVEVTPPPSGSRLAALGEKPSLLELYTGVARLRKTPGNDALSSPVANLRKEEIRRVIAIVAGDTSVGAMTRVRKFVDEQVGPGDMVSVRSVLRTVTGVGRGADVQTRDSMGIFQQFTNDKRQLDAATEQLPRVCTMHHLCLPDVIGTLTAAIRSLQDLPGRKALLLVGRYKGPVDNIINLANRAGVVIYVLDTEGVVYGAPTLEETVAPDSERLLAERTGGRRILSTVGFDLTTSFNEVIEDLSGYYLLGYHPAVDDAALKPPVRHNIEVRVLRAGLTVRVRDGLMGAADPVANPAPQPRGRDEVLTSSLFSAFTQDGIRVHLEPLFAASSPDRKGKRSPIVRAVLDIDGRDVAFSESEGGKEKTVLDVVVAVFDADQTQAGAANKAFTILLPKVKAAAFANSSLRYMLDVPLSKPGPYQVRAAVRDQTSGAVWSSHAFLNIPDFNQTKISLSSLVLSVPAGPAAARKDWNEFIPGTTVQYGCEVFGLRTPRNVETEARLYRGGGPVAGVPPSRVRIERLGEQSFLTGSMRIPENLPPGNYTMEVLAYDRLQSSKKKQVAEQWIDVAVVSPPK
jgi:VWFA-related protein